MHAETIARYFDLNGTIEEMLQANKITPEDAEIAMNDLRDTTVDYIGSVPTMSMAKRLIEKNLIHEYAWLPPEIEEKLKME